MAILDSERWSARILLFCSSLAFISVFLEELGTHLGPAWVWFLSFVCWKLAGRWSRKAFPSHEVAVPGQEAAISDIKIFEHGISFLIFAFAAYHLLFYFFEFKGQWVIKNPDLNGDWPFHLDQINYLVKLDHLWPENPILAGDHLRYAFGINWLTALFVRGGLPLGFVVMVSSVILLLVLVNQLYLWFGLAALVIFFFSGGGWGLPDPSTLWGPGSTIAWKNLFLAIFVPQRGMWLAFPTGVFLFRLLFRHLDQPGGLSKHQKRVFAFLWAMLPFFHLHTFALISLLVGVMAITTPMPSLLFSLFPRMWIPLFFLYKSVGRENVGRSLHVAMNWMSDNEPLWRSYLVNFGPWLLIPVILLCVPRLFKNASLQRALFLFTLAFGFFFSHVILAVWNWDESRILLWIFLILSAIFVRRLETLPWFSRGHEIEIHGAPQPQFWGRVLLPLLMLVISIPGFYQFYGGLPARLNNIPLWSVEDAETVSALVSGIPHDARVLVAPDPHHPVFATGQPIAAGYDGHLWSHGIDISGLADSLKNAALGAPPTESRWQRLQVPYLLWGPEEKRWLQIEAPPAEAHWIKLKTIGDRSLYFRSNP